MWSVQTRGARSGCFCCFSCPPRLPPTSGTGRGGALSTCLFLVAVDVGSDLEEAKLRALVAATRTAWNGTTNYVGGTYKVTTTDAGGVTVDAHTHRIARVNMT